MENPEKTSIAAAAAEAAQNAGSEQQAVQAVQTADADATTAATAATAAIVQNEGFGDADNARPQDLERPVAPPVNPQAEQQAKAEEAARITKEWIRDLGDDSEACTAIKQSLINDAHHAGYRGIFVDSDLYRQHVTDVFNTRMASSRPPESWVAASGAPVAAAGVGPGVPDAAVPASLNDHVVAALVEMQGKLMDCANYLAARAGEIDLVVARLKA